MSIRVMSLGGWRFGRRHRQAVAPTASVTTVEQAARLAPQWGNVEVRHAQADSARTTVPGWHGPHL